MKLDLQFKKGVKFFVSLKELIYSFPFAVGMMLLFCIPCVLQILTYRHKKHEQRHLIHKFEEIKRKAALHGDMLQEKQRFFEKAKHMDPYFIEKHLDKRPFLLKKKEWLATFTTHPFFKTSPLLSDMKRKLAQNQTYLLTRNRTEKENIVEIDYALQHPVLMDLNEIKQILSYFDRVQIPPFVPIAHRPNLVLTSFVLKPTKYLDEFVVNFSFIEKRPSQKLQEKINVS